MVYDGCEQCFENRACWQKPDYQTMRRLIAPGVNTRDNAINCDGLDASVSLLSQCHQHNFDKAGV